MPQINRIRVNNVKYNFGTQYYDDFLMRFSCKNSIYDLANGGGKSVLMLLLLQNLIPNCTLDDKQPIEKLFRTGNDNTAIHSLVEWKLDACDVKNGFKYMLTGFCARKAKESADESERNFETANIEYFNYCIFYREFGENDIKNLPLSNGKERVTYNGLKAYLRDLEKRDFGVEVKIFDRKGDYQNFISNYGLYESQWEIVRGINRTEGHVRTYFESNYKTTRKVIEDLLIEEIIEKSYNNRIRRGEEDDSQMAKTLLDIKDKLIELAKRREDINVYDEQIALLNDFADRLESFKNIFSDKHTAEEKLITCLLMCRKKLAGEKIKSEEIETKKNELEQKAEELKRLLSVAEIETEMSELEKVDALIEETKGKKDILLHKKNDISEELRYKEAAGDYFDYIRNREKYDELKELINNSSADKAEVLKELKKLAVTKYNFITVRNEKTIREYEESNERAVKLKTELEAASADKMNIYGLMNKTQGLVEELKKETESISSGLDELMSETGIIAAVNAAAGLAEITEEISTAKSNISNLEKLLETERDKFADFRQRITECDARLSLTGEEIDRCSREIEESTELFKRLDNIKNVYGEINTVQLTGKIEKMLRNLSADIVRTGDELDTLKKYEKCIRENTLPEYEKHFNEFYEYLKKRFDDVKSGAELLMSMNEEERFEAMKAFPQMVYAVFADESYDEITKDKSILRLNTGSYIIPVFKKSLFESGEIPYENMTVAYRDMTFMSDESKVKAELDKTADDIEKMTDRLKRLNDKYEVIEKDLYDTKYILGQADPDRLEAHIKELRENYDRLENDKRNSIESLEVIRERINGFSESLKAENEHLDKLIVTEGRVKYIKDRNDLLNEKYVSLKEAESKLKDYNREYANIAKKTEYLESEFKDSDRIRKALKEELDKTEQDFEQKFKAYYDDSTSPYTGMSEEEIDARAGALRKIISEEMGEMADKERLLATYESAMKKALDNLKYNALTLEAAKEAKDRGLLSESTVEERLEMKGRLAKVTDELQILEESINSEQTHRSRIEGSVWHGQKLYEEKYGEFVRENINNPQAYILTARHEISEITGKILSAGKELKALEEANRDALLMEKDITRIVKNAGLEVADNAVLQDDSVMQDFSAEEYELIQKQYEKICREEQKRKNVFLEEKQKLADSLNSLKAYELAGEIKRSLDVPSDIADVDAMIRGLKDTNDCIALERDNIEQGISDMQRIKESFEERCIQICSNIRTELERLPKLSRISLDDEIISMITLSVPYVKEELYRDRMSVYINETVSCAETLSTPEEKLKYIKGQLSWKKLFSVIVTDMNSIKLCLYKREHIKDRSRYLRYEEAVGSTGQSQGIYIQFLIAVINYISNINAAGRDTGATGKTIFIDNPFGAAKDVYIWEPIFKLLKTNHVQLIVPARGATPAITRMFDVNYILGQKMVGDRQQTVVVDYRSQADMDEMDYQIMEFEQTTLNLD